MAEITKNAFKGYTYQQYVFLLFVSLMDTERQISSLEIEARTPDNFDDMVVRELDNEFWVQVKNYPNVEIDDIAISNGKVKIKTNYSHYNLKRNNIVIINTDKIQPSGVEIFGLPAVTKDEIYIIPLTTDKIESILDNLFSRKSRLNKIMNFVYDMCINWPGKLCINDLPKFARLSTDLGQNTVLLRDVLTHIENGITCIIGRPGIGKSHYAKELKEKFPNALLYRFSVGSQDAKYSERLSFKHFLNDIASEIYKSLRKFTIEELIDDINNLNYPIIIDGLDHVENYNPRELDAFISFIDSIQNAQVLVLSRPLVYNLTWNKIELENWNKDETFLYLNESHQLKEYGVLDKIYDIGRGYPIITFFLAEHYKKYGALNISEPISSIGDYYSKLMQDVKTRDAMGIFLLNDSFFQKEELVKVCNDIALSNIIHAFISDYPYLFKHSANRISLIHNSLNTYLRFVCNMENWIEAQNRIKLSISKKEPRYLSRLASFNFDEVFVSEMLRLYADMDIYEQLMESVFDFASIQELYSGLRQLLEYAPLALDEYQYYSFVLICSMAERNNMVNYDKIIYQILVYADRKGIDEKNIFSSGYFWCCYLIYKYGNDTNYKYFINENSYSDSSLNSVYDDFAKEKNFFAVHYASFSQNEAWNKFTQLKTEYDKRYYLKSYIVKVWINNLHDDRLYAVLQQFLDDEENPQPLLELQSICEQHDIRDFMAEGILNGAKYRLLELGLVRSKNLFIENDIAGMIKKYAHEGSFSINEYLTSFLRLANYEKRDVDINSVSLFWNMYYRRKDYSVISVNDALMVFERKKLINEQSSLNLIIRVMEQSEKGIRHLLYEYINKKGISFVKQLNSNGFFYRDITLDTFDLEPELINEIDAKIISDRLCEILKYHYRTRNIRFSEIQNAVDSKYGAVVLDDIKYYNYRISDVPKNRTYLLNGMTIELADEKEEEIEPYVPFRNGNVHECDFNYIKRNKIHYLDIASYTGGWYACFPYVSIYEIYSKHDLQKDALKIIHKSLFAKIQRLEMSGDWKLCLGAIPEFLELVGLDIDWDRLYCIFCAFLRLSLIDNVPSIIIGDELKSCNLPCLELT